MTCGKCKSEFGDGNFCITCGASRSQAVEEIQLAAQKRDLREDAINFSNRAIASIKDFFIKVGKTFVILVIEPIVTFYRFALRNKVRSALVGLVVFLGLGYVISQSLICNLVGPEQTVSRYVAAIKSGDFTALEDPSLFHGSSVTPEVIQTAWLPERVKSTNFEVVSQKDGKAEVKISNASESYTIHLTATPKLYFIYSIPEWSVTEAAPISSIRIENGIDKAQLISFAGNPAEKIAQSTLTSTLQAFNVLPGYYSANVEGLGFNKTTDTETSLFGTANRPIRVAAETINLPGTAITSANAKAKSVASACAQSKCSAISRYEDTDFNLWSQFSNTGYSYTSSRFDYKLLAPSCGSPTFIASSAFRGELSFSCTGTVKAHLYVRDTYYSGWYSDYYYYWNFYDTDTYSMSVHVKVSTDANGKVTLGAVSKD